ncbi:MAG: N-acetylmuramoyl-L-alanine amidase [Spirochaetes bacterium]|nr:N-acetylmuramoyl-L-alanine amidase [Spirochaetota bacterium]
MTFRVVLDPGHGGLSLVPKAKHGDRYDLISKKYLSYYSQGTKYGKIEERIITYEIAEKVKNILDLTLEDYTFKKFREIINKYTNDNPERIIIRSILSRRKSSDTGSLNSEDPNADFRLFDYVDKHGNKKHGRISFINSYKPHLVVSLHCDFQAPVFHRGINPVISAPHSLLYRGLNYLKGNEKSRKFFFNSPYADWFAESVNKTGYRWFLKDVSSYFTGLPVEDRIDIEDKFTGYIYNMVSWKYGDNSGWENTARNHPKKTQYAANPKDFCLQGKFWEREQSIYESYRRDGGIEGFGGDNLYASSEIIRYILLSFYQSGNIYPRQKPGKPYISVWSLPILVNAINAYIELGYLKNKKDRYVLTDKQDEIAEGIAVGIYCLFAGFKPKVSEFKHLPKGKRIDLSKYKLPSGESYFDIVVP